MEIGEISRVSAGEEFRVCKKCGHNLGFHTSFLRDGGEYRVIYICPNCGQSYDLGQRSII